MVAEIGGVELRTVDEARPPAAKERAAEEVHARGVDDTAVVTKPPGAVEHRQLDPRQVGPEPGRPHDRRDLPAAEIESQRWVGRDASSFEPLCRADLVVEPV